MDLLWDFIFKLNEDKKILNFSSHPCFLLVIVFDRERSLIEPPETPWISAMTPLHLTHRQIPNILQPF